MTNPPPAGVGGGSWELRLAPKCGGPPSGCSCKVVEMDRATRAGVTSLPANSRLDGIRNFIGIQHRDITALVDGSDKQLELELNELCMVESLESALAWIKCQVIGPGLSRECLHLSCLPKPSFADMACRVSDMSATCLHSCRRHGDIACWLECLNDTTFDDMSGIPDMSVFS